MTGNSWHSGVKSNRRVGVRPTGVFAGTLLVAAALLALAVAGWGVMELSILWSGAAVLALAGVLVLTLRGFPLFAILAAVAGAVVWGVATRTWLPDGWMDILGLLKFIGVNLGFDVPLIGAFLSALMLDARRLSRAAIDEAVSGRRWWGKPDDHLPRLKELEVLPSARFFALGEGGCTHLVVAGRRVALFLPTVWPHGEFTMDASGQVLRGGRLFVPGSEDVDGLAAEVHTWREQLSQVGGAVRGYLVVAPSRGDVSEDLVISVAPGEHLHLVHAHEMVEAAGRWLAAEPYRVELSVMERLLVIASGNKLPEPSPLARSFARMNTGAHPTVPASPMAADAAFAAAAGTDGPAGAEPGTLRGRLTRGRFGRSASGDTSRTEDRSEDRSESRRDAPPDTPSHLEDDVSSTRRGGDFEEDGAVRDRFGRTGRDPDPIAPASDSWESRTTRELVGSWDSESANKLAAWAADSGSDPASPRDDRLTLDDFGSQAAADRDYDRDHDHDRDSRRPWSSGRDETLAAEEESQRRVGRRRADPDDEPAADWRTPASSSPPPPTTSSSFSSSEPSSSGSSPLFGSSLSGVSAGGAPESPPDRFASLMSEFDRLASDPDRFGFALDGPEDLNAAPRDPGSFASEPGPPPSRFDPSAGADRFASPPPPERAWSSDAGPGWSSDRDRASGPGGDRADRGGAPDRDRPGRAPADTGRFSTGAGERPTQRPAERPAWTGSLFDGDKPELVAEPLELRRSWETDAEARSVRRRDRQQPGNPFTDDPVSGAPTSGVPTSGSPTSGAPRSGTSFAGSSTDGSWSTGSSAGAAFNGPSTAWPVSSAPTPGGPAAPSGYPRSDPHRADPPPGTPRARFASESPTRPDRSWDSPASDPSRTGPQSPWPGSSRPDPSHSDGPPAESAWPERPRSTPSRSEAHDRPGAARPDVSWPDAAGSDVSWSDQPRAGSSRSDVPPMEQPSAGASWRERSRADSSSMDAPSAGASWSGQTRSDAAGSGAARPDISWSDAAGSGAARPDVTWSDAAGPGAARPDAARSGGARPDVTWSDQPQAGSSRMGASPSGPSSADLADGSSWSERSRADSSPSDGSPVEVSWSQQSRSGSSWSERSGTDPSSMDVPSAGASWSGQGRPGAARPNVGRSDVSWSDAGRSDGAGAGVPGPGGARPDVSWADQPRAGSSRPGGPAMDEPSAGASWPDRTRPDSVRPDASWSDQPRPGALRGDAPWTEHGPGESGQADGRRGAGAGAQPGDWGAAPAEDEPAWWDAEAAQNARGRVDEEPPAEQQPAAGGKRSLWGRSKAGKGRKGQPAEAAPPANGRPAAAAPAAEDDWASEPATGPGREPGRRSGAPAERPRTPEQPRTPGRAGPPERAGSAERAGAAGRPAWATDPTSGYESDPSGEFTSESRARLGSRTGPGGNGGEQDRGAAVPGQRQRARDMMFDDDVAPLELNLDEEPKSPDQRSRRFLRRK
ncbi:hypothetical protein OHA72_00610 [Dactylosporangium sp. NBC_01737]|uniref:hypothetical protein n=1 Tax=Dactylosporangium sp. NBC_01737 TaxID=2975959 RepID=UPI002E0DE3EE|nr:hypothetical protein OHA72_00610 [Dactylosporangium sp. NBC_01737]